MIKVKRFTATWCGPCKVLAPIFSQLEQEMTNVTFETIDVDQHKDLTAQFNVTSVPTIIIEKNGEQVYRFSGVLPKTVIAGTIQKYL